MLGLLFGAFLIVGIVLLLIKLVVSLFVLPLRLGFGLIKLAIGLLIGIPLLIVLAVVGCPGGNCPCVDPHRPHRKRHLLILGDLET